MDEDVVGQLEAVLLQAGMGGEAGLDGALLCVDAGASSLVVGCLQGASCIQMCSRGSNTGCWPCGNHEFVDIWGPASCAREAVKNHGWQHRGRVGLWLAGVSISWSRWDRNSKHLALDQLACSLDDASGLHSAKRRSRQKGCEEKV